MLSIEAHSATPPFEQIRAQIVAAAASGAMPAGTKLPTVRALATELGLAAGTVAKAYRQLESDGVIETRGRFGSVIAVQSESARQHVERAAGELAALAKRLGMDAEQTRRIVDAALEAEASR